MNNLKFFITKLPILSLVILTGLLMRCAGIADELIYRNEHDILNAPVYTAVLEDVARLMGVGNAGSGITSKNDADTDLTEGAGGDGNTADGDSAEPALTKPEGYESAEAMAKRTGRSLEEIKKKRYKKSKGSYIYADSLPDEATHPVVGALDYGVCDEQYTDPFGTEYDYPNRGVFAQDKDYYSFQRVEDDYFDNALFIGDSQTDGLYNYGLIREHASFYALESVTIFNLFDVTIPFRSPTEQYDASLSEVLAKRDYGKIYICVGVNEMGVPDTTLFSNAYKKVIKRIRKAQPDAIIYIQGIMHLSVWYSANDPAFNNKNVVQRNEAISKLVNGHDIFYLDQNEVVCDGNGDLRADYTNDGIHLTAQHYPIWHEYLNNNAIYRGRMDR